MIKTIKVKKYMRLDELIKYIFENGIEDAKYHTSEIAPFGECEARISGSGNIKLNGYINKRTTFTVEVEEEITEDTVFQSILCVLDNGEMVLTNLYNSVNGMKKRHGSMKEVHAVINEKLELIWEAE